MADQGGSGFAGRAAEPGAGALRQANRALAVVQKRYGTPAGVGVDVAIPKTVTTASFTFARTEIDNKYGVHLETTWLTTKKVTSKTTTGFVAGFGSASGSIDTVSFLTFRDETA